MAITINLLPPELTPKGTIVRLADLARKANTVMLVIFLVVASGIVSIFLVDLFSIKNSNINQERLISQVKSLQATETSLILIRDRLVKIKAVLAERKDTVEKFGNLTSLGILPQIVEGDIEKESTEIEAILPNSANLTGLISGAIAADIYKNIYLSSFIFNQGLGYDVKLKFSD